MYTDGSHGIMDYLMLWEVFLILMMMCSLSVLDITKMGSVLVLLDGIPRRCCWCASLRTTSLLLVVGLTLSVPNTVMMGALLLPVLDTVTVGGPFVLEYRRDWSDHLTCPKHHHHGSPQMVTLNERYVGGHDSSDGRSTMTRLVHDTPDAGHDSSDGRDHGVRHYLS